MLQRATAIIDIGSNSARLVIYESSSRYGFHLICEKKSKVRIGEGAYEKDGYLQPVGIRRAYLALSEFRTTIKLYPVQETICVATSALRDAPNGDAFVAWIKERLDLDIQIIDGQTEAMYGAIAALNLLPIENGITIDIGGGSSDLALIQDAKIIDTYSLNVGTVRLKELFFDKQRPPSEASAFIQNELEKLPKHFTHNQAIGIGGTSRSLSKGIMRITQYPLQKIHAFGFKVRDHLEYFHNIATAKKTMLPYLHISKARFDTIREGALIYEEILKHIGAKRVMTSGVGVREGVFLHNFLRDDDLRFPRHLNPSIVSMLDRFQTLHTDTQQRQTSLSQLFELFARHFKELKPEYLKTLLYAIQLTPIGYRFNIYRSYQHAFYVTMQEFNYGVTHKEMILTALLLRFGGKEIYNREIYKEYEEILPKKSVLELLSFMYTLLVTLHKNSSIEEFQFSLENNLLTIHAEGSLYLAKEKLKDIQRPSKLKLKLMDTQEIPSYNF